MDYLGETSWMSGLNLANSKFQNSKFKIYLGPFGMTENAISIKYGVIFIYKTIFKEKKYFNLFFFV